MELNARYLPTHRTAAIYLTSDLSTVISHGGANSWKTEKKKRLENIFRANFLFKQLCIHLWVYSIAQYVGLLLLLLPLPLTTHTSSLITILSCNYRLRQREREKLQGFCLSLGYRSLLCPHTGGHDWFLYWAAKDHTRTHTRAIGPL